MEGFDDPGVFFSDNFGSEDQPDEGQINRQQVKNRLREFIRQFHEGNFSYRYRLVQTSCLLPMLTSTIKYPSIEKVTFKFFYCNMSSAINLIIDGYSMLGLYANM